MRRTFILSVLVLICVAYLLNKKLLVKRDDLASAKDKIANIARQPASRPGPDRQGAAPAKLHQAAGAAEPDPSASAEAAPWLPHSVADDDKVVHLTRGTFSVVEGAIVYGPDAQLDIGHGMLVSSPSGVMVSDVDQRHIAGDLVIDSQEGTTTTQNAFLSVDRAHVEITSDTAVTVKKDEPK
jgi:hypothetical protein